MEKRVKFAWNELQIKDLELFEFLGYEAFIDGDSKNIAFKNKG